MNLCKSDAYFVRALPCQYPGLYTSYVRTASQPIRLQRSFSGSVSYNKTFLFDYHSGQNIRKDNHYYHTYHRLPEDLENVKLSVAICSFSSVLSPSILLSLSF